MYFHPRVQFLGAITTRGRLVGLRRVFMAAVLVLLVAWLVLDTSKRPEQLISFGGVCVFILLLFLLSAHRTAVSLCSGRGVAVATAVSK